ncbi:MAG: uncharacterized protein JWN02_58, partial [Acidobacteria bacterium]|nr:uncharacterized protein [Acidobacteriota bacterium]
MFRALGSLLIALSFLPLSLAASEIPVSPAAIGPAPGFQTSPSLATDGAGFLGVWADDREGLGPVIYGARFGSNGQLLDPSGIRLGSSGAASVAYGDGRYLVVTSFLDTFSVAPDGTFEPGPRLGNQINTPQVIFGGRDFLVCWTEGLSLRAVFVIGDGAPSGAAFPFGVAGSDVATLQSVAFNGSHFIVLYTTGIQLRAAVLDSSGALMSDQALDQQQSPFGSGTAAVASNGGTFVAAWQVNGREIRAVQFDDRGVLKNAISTVRFPPADESINGIKLVPRDSGYVLFDTEGPTSFGAPHRVMALPVTTPAGLFAFGASRVVLSDPQLWANVPAAASNSSTTITLSQLWDPNRPAIESELFAVQTDALGQPTSGATRQAALLVTRAAAAQHDPSLASNDAGLLVAWQESRGEANGAAQIAATFFDRSGSQPVTNLVAPSSSAQELPSAAGVGASFFVAWREPYGALRARLLVHGVAAGPVLPIAAADTQPSAPVVRSD